MQGGEGGLHSAALLRLVAQPQLSLLDAVHPGQHLLLQVVDPALEQVLQAVRLRGLVTPADLLSGKAFWSVDGFGCAFFFYIIIDDYSLI